jgi:hypothetical protein
MVALSFLNHLGRILVVSERDELSVSQMIDLRFILHLFLSWMSLRANNDLLVIDAGTRSHDIVRRRAQSGTSRRISRTGSGTGRNRGMAPIRDRLGHMTATQRLGSFQYLLIRANLRPVCWPWLKRSSTASQRAASAARGSDRIYLYPVFKELRRQAMRSPVLTIDIREGHH